MKWMKEKSIRLFSQYQVRHRLDGIVLPYPTDSRNRKEFKEEPIRANEVISGIAGEDVIYARPSHGSWDKKFVILV